MSILRSYYLAFLMCVLPSLAYAQTYDFDVSLGNKHIGGHQFTLLENADGTQSVKSEAKFNVSFLAIDVFKYHHQSNEAWEQDCLKKLDAKTQENSKLTLVKGLQDGQAFKINMPLNTVINSECVMTFAYWNPKILKQKKLLNPQTGEYLATTIRYIGREQVKAKEQLLEAEHYKIHTSKFLIDIWYGLDQDWLALKSVTEDGEINYQRK